MFNAVKHLIYSKVVRLRTVSGYVQLSLLHMQNHNCGLENCCKGTEIC